MIVCVCHRVSDREIAAHARTACPDFDGLQDDLRVGTSCGACVDCAREVWDAARAAAPCAGRSIPVVHRLVPVAA